ncbi:MULTISPECIES: alpha/beta fold hydrolase [Actinokineospora]|uniref:Alpha/beta hydrolase n=1 Tax=Actinokineospora fastidiosa TaxID=1816 RepID=A0A918LB65_9PSEU|nr:MULTISPECIES: alpha/beta fold hydrolase [Actinokineospora]UVS79411.1 acetoin dehydrogenase E2 subunit dihydrolipoyllysine-residue acetyltransferase [Actinokineospora sp. UTMC 2448]GGS28232.1 alpha/beta hydrolase [Actinokineospora fastidiosa]
MRVVLGDGAELAVAAAGDPAAEVTVVLAHSYAQDHRVWHKIIDTLPHATEQPVRVLAYDHRGHGRSTAATPETATVEQLGDDLAELIADQASGHVVLAGHGMGGLALMSLTVRHVDLFTRRVAGLAFLATSASRLCDTSAAVPHSVGRVVQDLRGILGGSVDRVSRKAMAVGLRWLLLGDDPDPDDMRLVADMVSAHWPDTVALFRPGLDRYDREAALAVAADVPVLAMVGDRDRLVPAAHADALAGSAHDGAAVVLPGLGHMLPLEGAPQVLPRLVGLVHAALRKVGETW